LNFIDLIIIIDLLQTNPLYPMHIPMALAKLGDLRAVPLLIKMIKEPIVIEKSYGSDSSSSDDSFIYGSTTRLISESYSALRSFFRM
jgi:hypothetical protein